MIDTPRISRPGPELFDPRISFDTEREVMEVDFSNLHFDRQVEVNAFYDRIEERIAETGEEKWFFLVNYSNSRFDSDAWFAFARRGKALNLAHSQGSVRFDATDETRAQIERSAGTEEFDPNLFASREDALDRLAGMPSQRREKRVLEPDHDASDMARRITFDAGAGIMEADFSDFTFRDSRDVNQFYDHIEDRIRATDRKWYFLVNLNGCRIMPEAWIQYARRGKALNQAASLGSVRFAAGLETEAEIRMRATSQDFRPNIFNDRADALAALMQMAGGR